MLKSTKNNHNPIKFDRLVLIGGNIDKKTRINEIITNIGKVNTWR